jgi:plasmid maintenance system antidote protein VapI
MHERIRNSLARRLAERKWTDADLARVTGLTRLRINRVKNGRARPTIEEALRISRAFGSAVEQVFSLVARRDGTGA